MLLLRPPDFGNTFKFVANTRIHRTMNGDLRMLQGNAATWEGFTVHFRALSLIQINSFRDFINQTFGHQITLLDFENRRWTGMIVSPSIPIFKGRAGCNFSTEFEFEGQVVS